MPLAHLSRPLQLEPVQCGLAPYLANLDIGDAIEGFNKFAEMIDLRCSLEQQQQQQQQQPSSPSPSCWSGASLDNSSQWLSPAHASPFGSSSSCSSCCSSSSAAPSGASSPAPSERTAYTCGSSICSSPASSGQRKKNASAAERYRKRLKGRECNLSKQMDRELERNAKLRRDLEAKLALYREFVQLLAFNTSKSDADLAELGSQSLRNILNSLRNLTCLEETIDGETKFELEAQQARFERIIQDNHSRCQL